MSNKTTLALIGMCFTFTLLIMMCKPSGAIKLGGIFDENTIFYADSSLTDGSSVVREPQEIFFTYPAHVKSVEDANTLVCSIHPGLGVCLDNKLVTFLGVSSPGKNFPGGVDAINFVSKILKGNDVIIVTERDNLDEVGRIKATVYMITESGPLNINELMVNSGHAKIQE